MSLQFVFGNSGGGKTYYLYHAIIEEARKNPQKNYLILVPEQFTMETQSDLVQMHPGNSISNIDVLSFGRLSYRVLEELGGGNQVVLEDTGKSFLLRKIAEEKKDELNVLGSNLKKLGYIDEVKSFLSELMQYQISPEELLEYGSQTGQENLNYKLKDIYTIYSSFVDKTKENYITAEELLDLVRTMVDRSAWLKNSVIAFDGFTGFTPIQNSLIEELMGIVPKIYVSVTIDSREDPFKMGPMQELFYMSKKYVTTLMKLAQNAGTKVLEPVVLKEGSAYRYKNAPALLFLEQNLFRKKTGIYKEKCPELSITEVANPRVELEVAARKIKQLVQKEGYRYRDIAIVSGDVEGYGNYAEKIFTEYEIPIFLDTTKNIIFHPFIECIRGILDLFIKDFSYDTMMAYLRCGMSGIEMNQIDLLENYLLATGIHGLFMWKKKWVRNPIGLTEEQLDEMNQVREILLTQICPLKEAMCDEKSDINKKTNTLYSFLTSIHAGKILQEEEKSFEEKGDFIKAKEYSQIYRIVMELFEKLVELLGTEVVSVKEYKELLEAGFSAAEVAVVPQGNDCVVIGDIERTRLNHIKILFFVGVNDGIIPNISGSGGILSELERESMLAVEAPLAFGTRERALVQHFYLYLNMTKPGERLYISYGRTNEEGKTIRRSFLIGTLLKLFPELKVEQGEENTQEASLYTPAGSLGWFSKELRKIVAGEDTEKPLNDQWLGLFAWYQSQKEWHNQVDRIVDAAFLSNGDNAISEASARGIYGEKLKNSVSRLEQFESCAYAHFLRYGIGLQERKLHEFEPIDMGNVFHSAMDFYTKKVQDGNCRFGQVAPEQMQVWSSEAMEEALRANDGDKLYATARTSYLANRMKRVFQRTIGTVTKQIQQGEFEPTFHELPFFMDVELEQHKKIMSLVGRIDRIDLADIAEEKAVRVVDYKSSAKELDLAAFYYGLSLQLPIYMCAALEQVEKVYGHDKALPAGIFYYGMTDPILSVEEELTKEEANEQIEAKLRMNGLVNYDHGVIEKMDAIEKGRSSVIPVTLRTDGSLSSTSNAISETDFQEILAYARKKVAEAGTQIMEGDVKIRPYRTAKATGCDYCQFKSVCGFDTRLAGYYYNDLENLSEDEIMNKIKEDLTNEDEKGGETNDQ